MTLYLLYTVQWHCIQWPSFIIQCTSMPTTTLYTLYCTLYSERCTFTIQWTSCQTLNFVQLVYIIHYAVYSIQWYPYYTVSSYIVYYSLYSVKFWTSLYFTQYNVYYSLYSTSLSTTTFYIVQCILFTIQCKMLDVNIPYTEQCIFIHYTV